MWIFADNGQNVEVLNLIWRMNIDLTRHDPRLQASFRVQVKHFVSITFQFLASIKTETRLRAWDVDQILDFSQDDFPFRDQDTFQRSTPLFKSRDLTPEMLPRVAADNCNPMLQNVVYCLIFLNKNSAVLDGQNMSFCLDYLQKVLNLVLCSLPQILEDLSSQATKHAVARWSQYEQMSQAEKISYQAEMETLTEVQNNSSYVRTLAHLSDLLPLFTYLREFYLLDSQLGQNLQLFISWSQQHKITA